MKKSLFLLFASISFIGANAQIKNDKGTFTKPAAKDILVELQMTPNFNGNAWFGLNSGLLQAPFNSNSLKIRKFASDKKAHRFILGLNVGSVTTPNVQLNPNDPRSITQTTLSLNLGYGQEKHLAGAERLSTYWGWAANLGVGTQSNPSTTFNGPSTTITQFGIQGQLLTGMDYYVVPKVYLGLELSYGLGIVSSTTSVSAVPFVPGTSTTASGIGLSPAAGANFRIGYRF